MGDSRGFKGIQGDSRGFKGIQGHPYINVGVLNYSLYINVDAPGFMGEIYGCPRLLLILFFPIQRNPQINVGVPDYWIQGWGIQGDSRTPIYKYGCLKLLADSRTPIYKCGCLKLLAVYKCGCPRIHGRNLWVS